MRNKSLCIIVLSGSNPEEIHTFTSGSENSSDVRDCVQNLIRKYADADFKITETVITETIESGQLILEDMDMAIFITESE